MNIERCPYDTTEVSVRTLNGEGLLVWCEECGAAWEIRGSWIHRIKAPDVATVRRLREELFQTELVRGQAEK